VGAGASTGSCKPKTQDKAVTTDAGATDHASVQVGLGDHVDVEVTKLPAASAHSVLYALVMYNPTSSPNNRSTTDPPPPRQADEHGRSSDQEGRRTQVWSTKKPERRSTISAFNVAAMRELGAAAAPQGDGVHK